MIRSGKTRNGKQRLKCKGGGRASREERQGPRYSEEDKELILWAYLERPSMRILEPLLDRIGIHIEVPRLSSEELMGKRVGGASLQ